jgi:hypothetical protein
MRDCPEREIRAPKKSLPLTSVSKGKKRKGRSHYAYYTPTRRTSKRGLLDQADRFWNFVRSVRVMALLCRSAPPPRRFWTIWTGPMRLCT